MVLKAEPNDFLAPQHRQSPARIDSLVGDGWFEVKSASGREAVLQCMSRLLEGLHVRRRRASFFVKLQGRDDSALRISINAAARDGHWTGSCELYGVSFFVRGRLQKLEVPGDTGGEVMAIWSALRVYVHNLRRATRLALGRGEGKLRWVNSADGQNEPVAWKVVDLAPTGAGVIASDRDPMLPATPVAAELLLGATRIPLTVTGRRQRSGAEKTSLVGVSLDAGSAHEKLVHTYLGLRFPRLRHRSLVSRNRLTTLLDESGYLKLRLGEGLTEAWTQFCSPSSMDVVYEASDGTLLGHISSTRIYANTWVFHQLATIGGHRESGLCRIALYELVSSVPTAFDGTKALAMAYFSIELRWHKMLFSEFIDWLGDDALGIQFAWDRFERTLEAPACDVAPEYTVLSASAALLDVCAKLVRSHLPELLADAMDIDAQSLSSPQLNRTNARTRHVLCLLDGEELLGVALCETGPAGASLFNLFNIAQFYFKQGNELVPVAAQLELLAAVRAWYAAIGVSNPIVVAPTGTFQATAECGTELAERMGCVAFASEGIRQWEDYCRFRMGQLYLRKAVAAPVSATEEVS